MNREDQTPAARNHECQRCGSDEWTWCDYRGCSSCFEPDPEDELCDFVPTPEMRGEVPTAAWTLRLWLRWWWARLWRTHDYQYVINDRELPDEF